LRLIGIVANVTPTVLAIVRVMRQGNPKCGATRDDKDCAA